MENFTVEQKQPVLKFLAIGGLVALLIFSAWVAIQIIKVLPSAAQSLATMAASVYTFNPNQSPDLTVTRSQTITNTNEPITLSWADLDIPGSYIFSFECAEGVTMSLSTALKNFPTMTCNTPYDLGDVNTASIAVLTNKERFTDITYSLSFYRTNATTASASHKDTLTVVNTAISTSSLAVASSTPEVAPPALPAVVATSSATTTAPAAEPISQPATTTPVIVTEPKPETAPQPKPAPTPAPVYETVYTYAIPVSNPNGTIDLALTNLGLGTVNSNNQFIPSASVRRNQPGALQFAVHNIGTKTSESWNFIALLPGGSVYTSPTQTPLKPNERAVLTVEFPAFSDRTATTFAITIETDTETRLQNNNFVQTFTLSN